MNDFQNQLVRPTDALMAEIGRLTEPSLVLNDEETEVAVWGVWND